MATNRVEVVNKLQVPWILILQIVLIILKGAGVITWSWWWVFAPLWMTFGFIVVLLGGIALLSYIVNRP